MPTPNIKRAPRQAEALHAAVSAIYFADSSDYKSALWSVVRSLAPDLVDELETCPAAAWAKTQAALGAPPDNENRALRLKNAGLHQTIQQLQAQVTALQAAASLPLDIIELLTAGDLEPILMRAEEETLRLQLYAARQVLVQAGAARTQLPGAEAEVAAYRLGAVGAPHNETERLLFEAYLKGHCWACGDWDAAKGYYTDQSTRIMFALWRDRAALVLPKPALTSLGDPK